ncbi:MAG: 8-amino-7-oxononanoate synthase [Planctomycetota bacterium]
MKYTGLHFVSRELEKLKQQGLIRKFKTIAAINGPRVKITDDRSLMTGRRLLPAKDKWYLSFCTNDYLGLAQHPALRRAAIAAIKKFGVGSGASRLMAGTFTPHEELEQSLARFKQTEDALVFTSGYAANLGVITTLVNKNDFIFCDELNHASLVDACRLTGAKLYIYHHRDVTHLEEGLKRFKENKFAVCHRPSKIFIVTDSIFSMDGDPAPLREIVTLAQKYQAITIIDEAHGTGILGNRGLGLAEHLGVEKQIDVITGTFSKALGGIGGFVTGSKKLISYLRSKSRPFIFTTALPPASCAAGLKALEIIQTQPVLRKKLWANTDYIKNKLMESGFDRRGSETPIIPIMIGDEKKTLKIADYLWQKGFFVPAIRPPTVPYGQSRLRISVTAMHQRTHLDALLKCLKQIHLDR